MERHIELLMYSVKKVLQMAESYPKDENCIFVISLFLSVHFVLHMMHRKTHR